MSSDAGEPDFRTILQREYVWRRQRNAAYSLRAFAGLVELSPSRLCEVLSGGQRLSEASARRVSRALGYSAAETEYFCDLVDAEHPRSMGRRAAAAARLAARRAAGERHLDERALGVVGSWVSLAILEWVQAFERDVTLKELAADLRITALEAQDGLRRLTAAGLLRRTRRGYVAAAATLTAGDGVPSGAVRSLHRQLIGKSLRALEEQEMAARRFDALVFRVDRRRLAEVQARMLGFVEAIDRDFGQGPGRDALYSVTMQLFDLAPGRTPE